MCFMVFLRVVLSFVFLSCIFTWRVSSVNAVPVRPCCVHNARYNLLQLNDGRML